MICFSFKYVAAVYGLEEGLVVCQTPSRNHLGHVYVYFDGISSLTKTGPVQVGFSEQIIRTKVDRNISQKVAADCSDILPSGGVTTRKRHRDR